MVGYLSSQPDWAGYQVSTKKGSGPSSFRGDVGVDSKGTRDGRLYAHRHKAYRGRQIHHTKGHNLAFLLYLSQRYR
ncbi:hypothetical protein CIP107555_02033 [Corynebacterium diphtheriae]|nr:hypothetical protein CIP107555_02033 [Corynebacterium diphtheriae]VEJ66500.1 Uncharacterised protein [Corynebacterium diphtheriae]